MLRDSVLIDAVDRLCQYAKSGASDWSSFGNIKSERLGDFVILNYTQKAMYEATWNPYEIVCRGLIIDAVSGCVLARPFDKFFNWNEGGRISSSRITSVTEKMDGSLGISFPRLDGTFGVATRGSFLSDQSIWATAEMQKLNWQEIDPAWTFLFEIVYPENRIVVDYSGYRGLVLLAIRKRESGLYSEMDAVREVAEIIGCDCVRSFAVTSVDDLLQSIETLDANHEGFVAEFADGSRFKFKGKEYLSVAKAIQNLTFRNVLTAIQEGSFELTLSAVPEEFREEAIGWNRTVRDTVESVASQVTTAFSDAPKGNRKDFAIWVNEKHPDLAPYLFKMFSGDEFRKTLVNRIDRHMQIDGRTG